MTGIIYQINTGYGGVPKQSVPFARVTRERLEGDNWNWHGHGGTEQAICLYSLECLAILKEQGFPVFPGALGENFTTQGLDHHLIRIGDVYHVGSAVHIQITKVRTPCSTIRSAYNPRAPQGADIKQSMWDADIKKGDFSSPKWGMTGFYARVLVEGIVHQGDTIERIAESRT